MPDGLRLRVPSGVTPRLRSGTPTVLAAGSQALGLVQILLLLRWVGASHATDLYFYISAWTLLPIQIVLQGVLYPSWLRSSRASITDDRSWVAFVCGCSFVSAFIAAAIFAAIRHPSQWLWSDSAVLGLTAAVLSLGWAKALMFSAHGAAAWLSAVTLANSIGGIAALSIAPRGWGRDGQVFAMLVGMMAGAMLYTAAIARRSGPVSRVEAATSTPMNGWFLGRSLTGYGAGIGMQTLSSTLPAHGLSVINVVVKLVSGFGTIVTNTVLPRLVHIRSETGDAAAIYARLATGSFAGIGAALLVVEFAVPSEWLSYAVLGAVWALAAAVSATVQRAGFRFLPAAANLSPIASAVLVPVGFTVVLGLVDLTVRVLLLGFILLDLLPAVITASLLRQYRLAVVVAGVSAVLIVGAFMAA